MAQKKITDLTLRSDFDETCNLPTDDTAQTWRVTGAQIFNYINSILRPAISAQTANYTVLTTDDVITMSATGGARTVTLPTAVGLSGRKFTIKKIDATSNAAQLLTTSGQTIDRYASGALYLSYQDSSITVVSDNANWIITDMSQGFNSSMPTGVIVQWGGTTAPTGWALCDGSAVSRTTYAGLFSVISDVYGIGNGTSTFNLPDHRGVFVRGAGSQVISGITYTGTRGTTQADAMQGHIHQNQSKRANSTTGDFSFISNGDNVGTTWTNPSGVPATDGANGTPRTAAETRPANISVTHIIKL